MCKHSNNDESNLRAFLLIIVILCGFMFLGFYLGKADGAQNVWNEALKQGVAEKYVNEYGRADWRWKNKP